jgi:hypothetical protein
MAATIETTGRTATRPWNIIGSATTGSTVDNEGSGLQPLVAELDAYPSGSNMRRQTDVMISARPDRDR